MKLRNIYADIANSYARYGCIQDAPPPTCQETAFSVEWVHPDYHIEERNETTNFSLRNDVALLKLNEYLDYDQLQQAGAGTVCLPTKRIPIGEKARVLGWVKQDLGIFGFLDVFQIFGQSAILKEV